MKVYIKSVTKISDIEAKIAKKQAEIDKKTAWIQKKEANIAKKFAVIKPLVSSEEFDKIQSGIDYLKSNNRYRRPEEYNLWSIKDKYRNVTVNSKGEDIYDFISNCEYDAESIYNSKCAIDEAQATLDNYKAKIDALKGKADEIDRIPDCLKEFMNNIIEHWDEYDINLRDESKPYYHQLRKDADKILYGENSIRSAYNSDNKLKEMYPSISRSWNRTKQFEDDYIYSPFKKKFGQSVQYCTSLWGMTDQQIHDENKKAAENLILDLLKRVTKITGPVVDWSELYVTRGNLGAVLNGIVIGEDGRAEVESIYANGPVQRLHIRTLVKPIRS